MWKAIGRHNPFLSQGNSDKRGKKMEKVKYYRIVIIPSYLRAIRTQKHIIKEAKNEEVIIPSYLRAIRTHYHAILLGVGNSKVIIPSYLRAIRTAASVCAGNFRS